MISLDDVVALAKEELQYFDTNQDVWFEVTANNAIKQFGCQDIIIKENECIELDQNGRWFFPKGFYQLILFTGLNNVGTGQVPTWSPIVYWEQPFLRQIGI